MTSTPEQVIAKIREALEAGPTPGLWYTGHLCDDAHPCNCASILSDTGIMGAVATVHVDNGLLISDGGNDAPKLAEAKANQRFIAACNPRNIAVLLAAVESLQTNIERLTSNPADHRYWEGRFRDSEAELTDTQTAIACMNEDHAALKAERDALRNDVERHVAIAVELANDPAALQSAADTPAPPPPQSHLAGSKPTIAVGTFTICELYAGRTVESDHVFMEPADDLILLMDGTEQRTVLPSKEDVRRALEIIERANGADLDEWTGGVLPSDDIREALAAIKSSRENENAR